MYIYIYIHTYIRRVSALEPLPAFAAGRVLGLIVAQLGLGLGGKGKCTGGLLLALTGTALCERSWVFAVPNHFRRLLTGTTWDIPTPTIRQLLNS